MIGDPSLVAEVARIAEALGLGLDDAACDALARYVALLLKWNAAYNLTAVRDPSAVLTHHIADCLAVVPALLRRYSSARVLDVGSGGGLPGVVVAVAAPAFDVTCVDAVAKKAAFVRQVAGALDIRNLHAIHGRVEALDAGAFDVIASRAFASLGDFCRLTERLLKPGCVWMAMKGHAPADEIAGLPSSVEVFHVEHLAVPGLAAERCLVWMRRAGADLR